MNLLSRRLLAYAVDFVLLAFLTSIFTFSASVFALSSETANQSSYMIVSLIVTNLLLTSYIPTKTNGSTIGKLIFKLQVVNENGKSRTYWQNFLREGVLKFAFFAFFIPMNVIYCIMISVSNKKLSLVWAHDVLLKTDVKFRR